MPTNKQAGYRDLILTAVKIDYGYHRMLKYSSDQLSSLILILLLAYYHKIVYIGY